MFAASADLVKANTSIHAGSSLLLLLRGGSKSAVESLETEMGSRVCMKSHPRPAVLGLLVSAASTAAVVDISEACEAAGAPSCVWSGSFLSKDSVFSGMATSLWHVLGTALWQQKQGCLLCPSEGAGGGRKDLKGCSGVLVLSFFLAST